MTLPVDPDDDKCNEDYQRTLDVYKLLVENRFRLLTLVPAATAVAVALVGKGAGSADVGGAGVAVAVSALGLVATFGIIIYEIRNSQLHDWVVHRLKYLEGRLKRERSTRTRSDPKDIKPEYANQSDVESGASGLFSERPKRYKVKHDMALAIVYGASVAGWLLLLGRSLLQWIQMHWNSLDPASPVGRGQLLDWLIMIAIAGIVGGVIAGVVVWDSSNKKRPKPW